MQQNQRQYLTPVLFFIALSLYLTEPTLPSCVLYGAVTTFFCFEYFTLPKLLFCELVFVAISIGVLRLSKGSGYVIPLLSISAGLYFDGSLRA